MTEARDGPPPDRADLAGKAAILLSTVLWGTLWIPMRQMEGTAFTVAPAPTFGFLIGLAILLPFGLLKLHRVLAGDRPVVLAGLAEFAAKRPAAGGP